jgi:hypothetical protein
MYTPRIAEDLIPILYHTAKARREPMTRLVDAFIRAGLAALPRAMDHLAALVPDTQDNAAEKGGA